MANGHDNVLDLTLQGLPVDEPHAEARGFDGFLRDEYRGLVQFLRRRTATEQDAEDAAQESLARLLRYKESEPASAWKPLLYRIATNVAHDQSRVVITHRTDKHVSLEHQEVAADAPTPEQQAVRDQEIARLTRAILQLPPKCQRVYLLKRVHGLSRAQVAKRCGISVKMVEKHLATALVQLRRRVGDEASGTF